MPRPKTSIIGAFKLYQVQTLTGVAADTTGDFVLSAKGAQPEWMYQVTNRNLGSSFVQSHAWCSALNAVTVRIANITGTSASIGSSAFDIVGF